MLALLTAVFCEVRYHAAPAEWKLYNTWIPAMTAQMWRRLVAPSLHYTRSAGDVPQRKAANSSNLNLRGENSISLCWVL